MSNPFLDGIGKVLGKVADQLQGRIERLKNERVKLIVERDRLMKLECTTEMANKVSTIDKRLKEIDEILINNAKD